MGDLTTCPNWFSLIFKVADLYIKGSHGFYSEWDAAQFNGGRGVQKYFDQGKKFIDTERPRRDIATLAQILVFKY